MLDDRIDHLSETAYNQLLTGDLRELNVGDRKLRSMLLARRAIFLAFTLLGLLPKLSYARRESDSLPK